ncbi:hypothetical protein GDO78_007674 [Eleutherodactylus coqui]|uniref:BTB domain-containing protein n=1 Tax=Eleutherodactylus coqui TaxID=57060 RepID=A0A8J6FJT2_ELECQ|nr:hypothetical protein GDO78_007674 [Eleutherodactylus coqui]
MCWHIVSLGTEDNEVLEPEESMSVVARCLQRKSYGWEIEIDDNHPVFKVYRPNLRGNVEIVLHDCPDWDTFASDFQSSLTTLAGGDIIILKFPVENKSIFQEIKDNFAPLLKQIFKHRPSTPILILAVGLRLKSGPSCTCPMCVSDRNMGVSPLEGTQLARDIGLGATYLDLGCPGISHTMKYLGGVLEYLIQQAMDQQLDAAKRKGENQVLNVHPHPPILGPPEKLPCLKDEASQYISDFKTLLERCQCVDVVFCAADASPVCAAHRVVLCSVSSVFMLLFGVISTKDVGDSSTQQTVRALFSVHQEPEVSTKNSPVRVIVKDALFLKCLSDILHFIYSGASQWKLLEHHLKEKLKDAEELAHVSHIVRSVFTKPVTDSDSGKLQPLWKSLGLFYNNPSLSDVIFQVQDTKIPAHRAVLVARCEVMAAMFSGSYMEANSVLIPVHGISKDTFLAFLEYIYTDTVCPASVLQAMSLLIYSEMYQISRLQMICEHCIATQLQSVPSRELASTSLNVVSLLKKAKFHNSENLYTWLLYFVATHYPIFSQKQEFQDLSAKELDFVEKHKWPSNTYLTELEEYRRYIHPQKKRCTLL